MLRHTFTFALTLASIAGDRPARSAEQTRPNVLMIAIDDLSDYVSILQNHPGIKTPNFDRLAQRSVNFTRAYCAAPLCNPSRVAISTGMAPHQTGIYQLGDLMTKSPPAVASVLLEEQFHRHGYDTFLTGKYYHAKPERWWPEDRLAAMWTQRKLPFSDHGPKLQNGNKVMGGGIFAIGPAPDGMESMPDAAILKNTQGWLAQHRDKPFLLVHGISKPHVAFVVPQQFFDMYPLDSVVLPETPEDDYSDIPPTVKDTFLGRGDLETFARVHKAENGWKEVMQAYLASISFCDWVLGQILDALDTSPDADNTIIVLWSDHGYHIGEKEWLHKRALWTQTSRVPFLISVPGMATAGRSCPAAVSLLDIYPTLSDLCGLDQPVPQELAGHSLVPLLTDPDHEWPHVALTSHDIGNAAVTDARYHYIQYADGSEELYDHETDSREFHNLANAPGLRPVVTQLSAYLPSEWVPRPGPGKGRTGRDTEE